MSLLKAKKKKESDKSYVTELTFCNARSMSVF